MRGSCGCAATRPPRSPTMPATASARWSLTRSPYTKRWMAMARAVLIGHDWGAEAAYDAAEEEAASHQAQQPTLYLHGSADGNIAVELVRGAERHLAPGSRMIVVEGAGHFPHYVCCRETGSGQGPGSGLRRGRGGGAGAAFAGGGGAGWLSAHVVADAGHDVAEVVQVVVGQGVEQQAAGDLDVTR